MLDGRVRKLAMYEVEVYDLAGTHGPRGRGEASIISGTIRADREGVIASFRGFELLIPTALIATARKIAGKTREGVVGSRG